VALSDTIYDFFVGLSRHPQKDHVYCNHIEDIEDYAGIFDLKEFYLYSRVELISYIVCEEYISDLNKTLVLLCLTSIILLYLRIGFLQLLLTDQLKQVYLEQRTEFHEPEVVFIMKKHCSGFPGDESNRFAQPEYRF
jgi:hypothetical protein